MHEDGDDLAAFIELFKAMLWKGEIEVDLDALTDERAGVARAFCLWKAEQDPGSPDAQLWIQSASHLRGLTGDHRLVKDVEAAMEREFQGGVGEA